MVNQSQDPTKAVRLMLRSNSVLHTVADIGDVLMHIAHIHTYIDIGNLNLNYCEVFDIFANKNWPVQVDTTEMRDLRVGGTGSR